MLFYEIIIACSEGKARKPINAICGKRAELLNVKAGGTYSYHYTLKC
jgi:hypothetical protein